MNNIFNNWSEAEKDVLYEFSEIVKIGKEIYDSFFGQKYLYCRTDYFRETENLKQIATKLLYEKLNQIRDVFLDCNLRINQQMALNVNNIVDFLVNLYTEAHTKKRVILKELANSLNLDFFEPLDVIYNKLRAENNQKYLNAAGSSDLFDTICNLEELDSNGTTNDELMTDETIANDNPNRNRERMYMPPILVFIDVLANQDYYSGDFDDVDYSKFLSYRDLKKIQSFIDIELLNDAQKRFYFIQNHIYKFNEYFSIDFKFQIDSFIKNINTAVFLHKAKRCEDNTLFFDADQFNSESIRNANTSEIEPQDDQQINSQTETHGKSQNNAQTEMCDESGSNGEVFIKLDSISKLDDFCDFNVNDRVSLDYINVWQLHLIPLINFAASMEIFNPYNYQTEINEDESMRDFMISSDIRNIVQKNGVFELEQFSQKYISGNKITNIFGTTNDDFESWITTNKISNYHEKFRTEKDLRFGVNTTFDQCGFRIEKIYADTNEICESDDEACENEMDPNNASCENKSENNTTAIVPDNDVKMEDSGKLMTKNNNELMSGNNNELMSGNNNELMSIVPTDKKRDIIKRVIYFTPAYLLKQKQQFNDVDFNQLACEEYKKQDLILRNIIDKIRQEMKQFTPISKMNLTKLNNVTLFERFDKY